MKILAKYQKNHIFFKFLAYITEQIYNHFKDNILKGDTMSDEKRCDNEMHKKHLCYLIYEGRHYSQPKEYKELVDEGNYICQNCGRTSKASESLCAPREL